jgi:hypothetical protein
MPTPRDHPKAEWAIQFLEQDADLPFVIELCKRGDEGVERVLGRAGDGAVAQRMFDQAVEQHPARRLMLKQGGRVLRQHN